MNYATVCIGKFNPIHIGHQHIFNVTLVVSEVNDSVPIIVNIVGNSNNKKRLSEQTIGNIIYKGTGITPRFYTNAYEAIEQLKLEGFIVNQIVCGSDRKGEYKNMTKRVYQNPNMDVIEYSAWRDQASDENRLKASSTLMRQFADNNDFESFCQLVPLWFGHDQAKQYFDSIRRGKNNA